MKSLPWRVGLPAVLAVLPCLTVCFHPAPVHAGDWPMLGHDPSRNMASPEKNLPVSAEISKGEGAEAEGKPFTATATKNVKWVAKLGSHAYGNPTVAGGRVYVGTNNENPRDERYKGDRGILMCLDEATGKLVWQLVVPKLSAGSNVDTQDMGLCSSPTVDGDRVYLVTNRCEVLCLDANGMANGNDGPFKDEAQYTAGPGNPPIPSAANDADIVWRYDMRLDLGVLPRRMTSSSVLVVGGRLYVTTSNGVDWTEKHVPSPWAPALICLDKKTGKLLGRERSGIGSRPFFGSWSSPAYGTVGGRPTVVFGGGDGVCYGFDPEPASGPDAEGTLKELWHVDCNPPGAREKNGKPLRFRTPTGPSEIVATPVLQNDRVYLPIGQVSEAGLGKEPGCLNCLGLTADKKIDVLWRYTKMSQTMSGVSVGQGLLFAADANGFVHCLDPQTGTAFWTHDLESEVWGATLLADGKVYAGAEAGEVTVLAASKEKRVLGKIDFRSNIYSSPIAANGVLYVATESQLYAIK